MSTPIRKPSLLQPPISLDSLRTAVQTLSVKGVGVVDAVRRAFTDGAAPLQTAGSGSASDFINRFADDRGIANEVIKSTSRFGVSSAPGGKLVAPPRPEIDFVEIANDQAYGVLDSFYTRVVISLPLIDVPRVSHFRILRSRNETLDVPAPSFSAMIDGMPLGTNKKGSDPIAASAFRVAEMGVGNKLTEYISDSRFTSQRSVVSSGTMRELPPPINTNKGATTAGLLTLTGADRAVVENVNFYVNQRAITLPKVLDLPLDVGQRQGVNLLRGSTVGAPGAIVEIGNVAGFAEIGRLSPTPSRKVGLYMELDFFDPAVVYGASYNYYVVAVAHDGIEGARSRIVRADISRHRPPATPEVVYSVVAGRPRFSIRVAGPFVDHIEVFRHGGAVPEYVQLLGTGKSLVTDGFGTKTDSGYYHIRDLGIGVDRSITFVDHDVTAGQELGYRFYSIDSFGAKSQSPFACSVRLPDDGSRIPLSSPSITVEQVQGDRVLSVLVSCDDPRVSTFVVGRRDLSTGEQEYRQPNQPDFFTHGTVSAKRSRSRNSPSLNSSSRRAWQGLLVPTSGSARFNDTTLDFDHVYQYSVHGIDIRGNHTSRVASRPLAVTSKPVSDAPVTLSGTVVIGDGGAPSHVALSWSVGTLDFSPADLIGDQDVLSATSLRTVFQVERRTVGKSIWESMPATTTNQFNDTVSTERAPKFRPSFARVGVHYDYRVIAMQSGGLLSTYTDPVRVVVTPDVLAPTLVWVRSTPTSARPVKVVVSWQYSGEFVDGWDVERAATNKIYGAKIFSMDDSTARQLDYVPVGMITRESSRAAGLGVELVFDPRVYVGNRFFIDQDISMANSYYYRIRARDTGGKVSGWSYGGISLTDSPYDRKMLSTLSDDQKSELSIDSRPMNWKGE